MYRTSYLSNRARLRVGNKTYYSKAFRLMEYMTSYRLFIIRRIKIVNVRWQQHSAVDRKQKQKWRVTRRSVCCGPTIVIEAVSDTEAVDSAL